MAEDKTISEVKQDQVKAPNQPVASSAGASVPSRDDKKFEKRPFQRSSRPPRKGGREDRVRQEYDQKILSMRRVARVTGGGKRFSLSVVLAIGNRRGMVGVGTGKGADTALAIEKALRDAKRQLLSVNVTSSMSIPHEVQAKYSSGTVLIMPAPRRGVIAGSALRDILELAGIRDINGKILSGSKNKLNIARAAIKALTMLTPISKKVASVAGVAPVKQPA